MNPIDLSPSPNPLHPICLIGKDGLPFISVNANGDMFINKICTRRGELSPRHQQTYDEFHKLFSQHVQGKITKQELLEEIFSEPEISHMTSSGLFDPTTGNVFIE